MGEVTKSVGEGRNALSNVRSDFMAKKTKEEIKAWVADEKRKKGDKLVIADEPTTSACLGRLKKELRLL